MADDNPPRLRATRAESKERTRRALLDAAQQCFVKLGYQGATLDAIAAEAGFTKGAVYWHFRSKEALFVSLLAEGLKRNAEETEQMISSLADNPELLRARLGEWIDQFDERTIVPLLALEMDMESRRNPSFSALLHEVVTKQQETVTRNLARYFELIGRDPPMPVAELATTLMALSKAVAIARQTKHSATLKTSTVARLLLGLPATGQQPTQ